MTRKYITFKERLKAGEWPRPRTTEVSEFHFYPYAFDLATREQTYQPDLMIILNDDQSILIRLGHLSRRISPKSAERLVNQLTLWRDRQ